MELCLSCTNLSIYASVNKATNGSNNGLSPAQPQAIIWTNAGSLLVDPLEQTSVKFESKYKSFHGIKWILKDSKWQAFFLNLNVLMVTKLDFLYGGSN